MINPRIPKVESWWDVFAVALFCLVAANIVAILTGAALLGVVFFVSELLERVV